MYNPKEYWSKRLEENFSLSGVGFSSFQLWKESRSTDCQILEDRRSTYWVRYGYCHGSGAFGGGNREEYEKMP